MWFPATSRVATPSFPWPHSLPLCGPPWTDIRAVCFRSAVINNTAENIFAQARVLSRPFLKRTSFQAAVAATDRVSPRAARLAPGYICPQWLLWQQEWKPLPSPRKVTADATLAVPPRDPLLAGLSVLGRLCDQGLRTHCHLSLNPPPLRLPCRPVMGVPSSLSPSHRCCLPCPAPVPFPGTVLLPGPVTL